MLWNRASSAALVSLAIALGTSVAGCGGGTRNYDVRGTQRDPGADAHMQVERLEGGNHLITFTATNMTPPDRLGSGYTRYVLWVQTGTAPARMETNLRYNPDERTGRASATTPYENFTVLVTAERQEESGTPSDAIVFQQTVSN